MIHNANIVTKIVFVLVVETSGYTCRVNNMVLSHIMGQRRISDRCRQSLRWTLDVAMRLNEKPETL